MDCPRNCCHCPPCLLMYAHYAYSTHILSDDPNGKALSVLSSSQPLSMNPRATCHYIHYLTCLHVDFTMFLEPSLVYFPSPRLPLLAGS